MLRSPIGRRTPMILLRVVVLATLCLLPSGQTSLGQTPVDQSSASQAPAGIPRDQLARQLAGAVTAARQDARQIGVEIVDLSSGDRVYAKSPDTPRIIASNTKLFTSAAALDRLGPGYFFETQVLVRGQVDQGALVGDLAIVGGGDPNLSGRHYYGDSYGAFREWAMRLSELGIRSIDGDLLLIHGLFDDQRVHPDWPKDQLDRWYEAPVEALSFNDNCVLVRVRPAGRTGAAAAVEVVPDLDLFSTRGRVLITGRRQEQIIRIGRDEGEGGGSVLKVGGRIYRSQGSFDRWVAVAEPLQYFGAALQDALAEEGIEHHGRLLAGSELPGDGWRLATVHRSDLLTTLEIINKRSQNFYAESVLKLLGAGLCDDGSWQGGVRAVREFLTEIGLSGDYQLADGSGMSRNNRFSPRQITHLLAHMLRHRWGQEFMQTLPYSGERDLRWEKRLAEAPYRGNILAKTGSLNGVSTLSGYAKGRSGTLYAFAILMNETRANWRAKKAQDRILRVLVDGG